LGVPAEALYKSKLKLNAYFTIHPFFIVLITCDFAGVAYMHQSLSHTTLNVREIGGAVSDITGSQNAFNPTVGAGIDVNIIQHLSVGVNDYYLFGTQPKAFNAMTTADGNLTKSDYQQVAHQPYILGTVTYHF
jgi:hypothetical protein